MGASKDSILKLIPAQYLPTSALLDSNNDFNKIKTKIEERKLEFPLILKPDIGERGNGVELIRDDDELKIYLDKSSTKVIIQEYLDMPLELGVFYYRFPNSEKGTVSSVVIKEFLSVSGDGEKSLRTLIKEKPRAKLQLRRLEQLMDNRLATIPKLNQQVLLEPIGNHNRGTAFLDGNNLINEHLIDIFDHLSKQIDGFFYGRFDIRCKDVNDLYKGEFKIMELNGAASEPAHIYAPKYSIIKGYKSLFHHWKTLYRISIMNHKRGIPYMNWNDGLQAIKKSRFV